MLYRKVIAQKLRDFYQNEQGVYSVLTAGVGFVLLSVIALTVDGSGMLLDKARLAQGVEQGALALAAEANMTRTDNLNSHRYFSSQQSNVSTRSPEEMEKICGNTTKDKIQCGKAYNRDQQLLNGYVQV